MKNVNFTRDVVFTWNATTSGVTVPHGDWISHDRLGLTICDASSAVFAVDLPWSKLDVVTYSWQKAMGSEGAHGMLILSPAAIERLVHYDPPWPLPKIFRLKKDGELLKSIFEAHTINTPSMLAVEDALDSLKWINSIGGIQQCIARTNQNALIFEQWISRTPWIDYLAEEPSQRSKTSLCLKIVDERFICQCNSNQRKFINDFVYLLEKMGVAYDIFSHRNAPIGLRIWTGPTVEASDLQALLPWLDWAFQETILSFK